MAGVFPNETTIFIVAANTDASSLALTDAVKGEISDFKQSGLEEDTTIKDVFGGQIEIEKPRSQGEISFNVSVQNTAGSVLDRWDKFRFSDGTSASESVIKQVYIQHYTNSLLKVFCVNNCRVTTGDTSMNANEELQKSITLKFNAVTPLGVANLRTSTISGSTLVANSNAFVNGVWSSS